MPMELDHEIERCGTGGGGKVGLQTGSKMARTLLQQAMQLPVKKGEKGSTGSVHAAHLLHFYRFLKRTARVKRLGYRG